MLTDAQFVEQSLTSNLFYLRTIREYCANIQLSFIKNKNNYITTAEEFALKCEELGRELIQYANRNVSKLALDSQIFVTDYTLDCERLTEKLFDIKIATDITEAELKLQPGNAQNFDQKTVQALTDINRRALALTNNFIYFCEEIYRNQRNNTVFSYSYPSLIAYMIDEANLYRKDLERLQERSGIDPIFVTDFETRFNNSMRDVATFIRGFIDPSENNIFVRADAFAREFQSLVDLYKRTPLTPENQKELTNKSMETVNRFREFLSELIQSVLRAKSYLIVEPIFLDNMYTEANYFRYILLLNRQKEL